MTSRFRFTAEVAVLLVVGGVIWAKAAPKTAQEAPKAIRTQRLEIVDSKGNVRGVFATQENGDPVITMLDSKGEGLLNFAITDGGKTVGVTLGAKPGSGDGIVIGVSADGTKALLMENKKGSVAVGVDNAGGASVEVEDKAGKKTLSP